MNAKYTPLDRCAVNLWLAVAAMQTAAAMLKRPEHKHQAEAIIGLITGLRAVLTKREVRR